MKYFIIVLCLCLVGILSARFVSPDAFLESREFPTAEASLRSFDIMVNTVGVLDAARSHILSSEIKGDKGKIIYLIDDGTPVNEGDLLVKLDTAPFEEEIQRLKGEVTALDAAVDAVQQVSEWEKSQAEREIRTAEFNLKIARLELKKLIEGDGPLQSAQLEEEMKKAQEEYDRYLSYISDLENLSRSGSDNSVKEIPAAANNISEQNEQYDSDRKRNGSYVVLRPLELSVFKEKNEKMQEKNDDDVSYSSTSKNSVEIASAKKKASELKERYESANKKYMSYEKYVFPSLEETAKAKVEKAQMELEQTKKASVFKIAKAISTVKETKGKLRTAENLLKQAQGELDKTKIHAPFPGIVVLYETFHEGQKRKPRLGDRVLQNQPLLYLPDISSMIVKTQVREIDLHKIVLGQKCSVKTDAYPDMQFEGEVSIVGILASGRFEGGAGEKYFQLTVSLKGGDARLRPGMTARVSVLTDQVVNALSVPIQTVFDENGRKYCYKFLGKKFEKVSISPGRQNEDVVEILAGLKEGEKISMIRQ
ncbi:MAG: hypothetical protein BWK80_01055 [Desulfobacteraceae bacterium IS3]|nr:MAG: hypothetical protein BWK80_01055 [Desulfobacteraceae bacterium IS3]